MLQNFVHMLVANTMLKHGIIAHDGDFKDRVLHI